MTRNRGLFGEEELIESKKLSKPVRNASLERTQSLFPFPILTLNKTKGIFIKPENDKNTSGDFNKDIGLDKNNLKKLIIKVAHKNTAPLTTFKQVKQFLYISRLEKKEESEELRIKNQYTFLYDHNDKIINTREEIQELAQKWNDDKHRKVGDVISRQITFSIGGKEDKEKVMTVTKQFLKETFATRGFEYCYAPHYDSDNDHFHVIIKKRNNFGQNLTLYKKDLNKLMKKYNDKLAEIGIQRDISSRLESKIALEKIIKGEETLANKSSWYQSKLNKGQEEEFNAYNYKSTLSTKIEEQVNIIKIKDYLSQLEVKDMTIINVIKPLLKQKGINTIEKALVSVKQAQEKSEIKDINGFILTSIRNEYKPNNKESKSLKTSESVKNEINVLRMIKSDITSKDNKKDILQVLDHSLDNLKETNKHLFETMEPIFKDRNIRYSFVSAKKPVENIDQIIETKIENKSKPKKQNYYQPEILTDYEIQHKFANFVREETKISPVGLETAIANAFANPGEIIKFGHRKENEIQWYGEVGYVKNSQKNYYEPWGVKKVEYNNSITYKSICNKDIEDKIKQVEEQIAQGLTNFKNLEKVESKEIVKNEVAKQVDGLKPEENKSIPTKLSSKL
ncbi:MAG: hypothetical protein PHY80_02640 [Rickettsiales bacterium]|nr:hypothetical protein [Rickettsiales bacterium]